MATLAAQFIIPWVLRYPLEDLTGGTRPLTVPAPMIGPFGSYADDALNDGEPLIFEAGDLYFVDVISVHLQAWLMAAIRPLNWSTRPAKSCPTAMSI